MSIEKIIIIKKDRKIEVLEEKTVSLIGENTLQVEREGRRFNYSRIATARKDLFEGIAGYGKPGWLVMMREDCSEIYSMPREPWFK